MNPSIKDLNESVDYRLVEKISYKEMLPFIIPYLKPINLLMYGFYLFNLVVLIIFVGLLIANGLEYYMGWLRLAFYIFVTTIVSIVLLIPIHEMLHGIVFKIMGASRLKFGANLHEMIFYVTCDRFVLNKKQFYFLALMPFIVITSLLFPVFVTGSFLTKLLSVYIIFFHSTCCVGDFAMISFFLINSPQKQAYTYDEVNESTSYFYIEK
jgi:Protein of unknown function (DUF3267).